MCQVGELPQGLLEGRTPRGFFWQFSSTNLKPLPSPAKLEAAQDMFPALEPTQQQCMVP